MLPPHIKNRYSDHPQTIMRPVHLRLSEEIIQHLEDTAKVHGFSRIQGLIRLSMTCYSLKNCVKKGLANPSSMKP